MKRERILLSPGRPLDHLGRKPSCTGAMLSPPFSTDERHTGALKWKLASIATPTVFALLLLAAITVAMSRSSSRKKREYHLCDTKGCKEFARMLTNSLSTKQNPCNNFYKYVCDGWLREQSESVYERHINYFLDLLAYTLSISVPQRGQTAGDKAARFFQTCRKVSTSPRGELIEFRKILEGCSVYWPKVVDEADVLKSLVCLTKRLMLENLLTIRKIFQDGSPAIYISSGQALTTFYKRSTVIQSLKKYRQYYESLQNAARAPGTEDKHLLDYTQFVSYESRIFQSLMTFATHANTEVRTDVATLAKLTPEISSGRWSSLFKLELDVSENTTVIMNEEDSNYMRAFSNLTTTVGEEYLHHEVGWIAFQVLSPFISKDLLEIYSGVRHTDSLTPDLDLQSTTNCLTLTEYFMGWATYTKLLGREDARTIWQDINHIVDDVGAATFRRINSSDMANGYTYEGSELWKLLNRMLRSEVLFARPLLLENTLSDLKYMGPVLSENWLRVVNASAWMNNATIADIVRTSFISHIVWNDQLTYDFYNVQRGEYLFPPYALVLPLYAHSVTQAVKYAALGSIVGAAALHLANYSSLNRDAVSCVNGTLKGEQDEWHLWTIAASVRVAWDAFHAANERRRDSRLEGLSQYSPEEIFFMSTCYIHCGQPEQPGSDSRCNEPLKHNPDFSKVFDCRVGSLMNPAKKCPLFLDE
ncbi:neprilysin-1-like [Ornithodoros turicata]|uniref:neprilysin-1-like n=1 Tax=Ornithodoros turicata TaxID=34597 RepID=UPI0031397439